MTGPAEGAAAELVRLGALLTGYPGHGEDLVQSALEKTFRAWRRIERGTPRCHEVPNPSGSRMASPQAAAQLDAQCSDPATSPDPAEVQPPGKQ